MKLFTLFIFMFGSFAFAHEFHEHGSPALHGGIPFKATLKTLEESQYLSNIRQVTLDGKRSGEGYFNRHGTQMIFQSEREGFENLPPNPFYQMWIMDFNQLKVEPVSTGIGRATCGWFHPTQNQVIFSSTHHDPQALEKQTQEIERRARGEKAPYAWDFDETYDIFLRDFNTKELRQLTFEKGYDAEASISPDGTKILFASNRKAYSESLSPEDQALLEKDPSAFMDLYIMDMDGSHIQQLTWEMGYDGGAFFSPDGSEIIYRHFDLSGRVAEIYTLSLKNTEARPSRKQITSLGAMSWAPYYHPSGDYIVFTSNLFGHSNFELFVTRTDGNSQPLRITHTIGFDGLPVFTPQGNQLTWASNRNGGGSQIFIADWNDALIREQLKLPLSQLPIPSKNIFPKYPVLQVSQKKRLEEDTFFLSAPATLGRLTGSTGIQLAQRYILNEWKSIGIEPFNDHYEHAFQFKIKANDLPKTDVNLVGLLNLTGQRGNKKGVIIIGAHLDHLGEGEVPSSRAPDSEKNKIHPGADDNASGSAVVLELARTLTQFRNEGLLLDSEFDILFAHWSGEELGVLGSDAFAKSIEGKENVLAYLNLDMVGRLREQLSLQGVGSAKELVGFIEKLNLKSITPINISLDPYLPTDAISFYLAKFPVISAFTGLHDEYHTPNDTFETVSLDGMVEVSNLYHALTLDLISVKNLTYVSVPRVGGGERFKVYLGTIPDYGGFSGYGVRLSGVQKDSPAEKAMLERGDIIVRLDGTDIRNIYDYTAVLARLQPEIAVEIEILRNDSRLKTFIIPKKR